MDLLNGDNIITTCFGSSSHHQVIHSIVSQVIECYVSFAVYVSLFHIFLTSALVGGEWPTSRPCRFTPGERILGPHWIGRWMGLGNDIDDVEE
jgi:hypothetical protein